MIERIDDEIHDARKLSTEEMNHMNMTHKVGSRCVAGDVQEIGVSNPLPIWYK